MATKQAPKRSVRERAIDAEALANRWLADGNEAAEAGNAAKADRCYEKAQFWLDRYNLLASKAERPGPLR